MLRFAELTSSCHTAVAILAVPSAQLRFTSELGMGRKAGSLGPEENVGETLMLVA